MISIIVCSNSRQDWDKHRRHCELTVGAAHEYIRVDNTGNEYSLTHAYNEGISRSSGDICAFVHEDVFFLTPAWGVALGSKFKDPRIGIVGVAGCQKLFAEFPLWMAAWHPYIRGRVVHQINEAIIFSEFSRSQVDSAAVAVDGLFFAARKSLFNDIKFDEETFDGFHFYDLDICMQARKKYSVMAAHDILVKHYSGGNFDNTWVRYAQSFMNKHMDDLPALVTGIK